MSTSFPLDGARVRFAGATNIGRKRDHNEDSISLPDNERLAIVADGMGGHASGEVASRLAVEMITGHFLETGKQQTLTWPYKVDRDLRTHVNRMVTGIMLANLEIWERSQRESRFKGMGTTRWRTRRSPHLVHVGDSATDAQRATQTPGSPYQRLHSDEARHARGGGELAAQERHRARARDEGERAGRHHHRRPMGTSGPCRTA
jgi:hypothetical protein